MAGAPILPWPDVPAGEVDPAWSRKKVGQWAAAYAGGYDG